MFGHFYGFQKAMTARSCVRVKHFFFAFIRFHLNESGPFGEKMYPPSNANLDIHLPLSSLNVSHGNTSHVVTFLAPVPLLKYVLRFFAHNTYFKRKQKNVAACNVMEVVNGTDFLLYPDH